MLKRWIWRIVKVFAGFALAAALCAAALLLLLWREHRAPVDLPSPTGDQAVGRTNFDWTDESRTNPYAPGAATKQELHVWMWYPAEASSLASAAEYLPKEWRLALNQYQGVLLNRFLYRDLALVRTHSLTDAKISNAERSYPVVLLRAGSAALSTDYTAIAEDLASHGYIVVSFDAPYRTVVFLFPDGCVATRKEATNPETVAGAQQTGIAEELVSAWTADSKFVVDQLAELNANDPTGRFTGRLDLHSVGMVGHSLGGATAAQFCHVDSRCKAGIDIDGQPFGSVTRDGLNEPFLFLMSDHEHESDPNAPAIARNLQGMYQSLPQNKRWAVTVRGSSHFSFTDHVLVMNPTAFWLFQKLGSVGNLDPSRGMDVTRTCVRTFFDVYLKSASPQEIRALGTQYPELIMGDRVVNLGHQRSTQP